MDELDQGTAPEGAADDQQVDTQLPETGDLTQGAQAETQPQQNEFERLIPPNELPEELKPHWKRMHGAYNKLISNAKELQQKAAIVDQFYSNQDYARQVLVQWAAQNGYQLAPLGGQPSQQQQQSQTQTASDVPPQLVEAVRARLKPELQWMAEDLAAGQWAANQMLLQPLVAQTQQQQYQQRASEFDSLAQELSETAPGWEEHESTMDELLQFLQGPAMKHPKFGNKLKVLYNAINGNASAMAEVTNRMTRSVKNANRSGLNGTRTVSNLQQRIKQAPNNTAAWELARQAALNSVNLPDDD